MQGKKAYKSCYLDWVDISLIQQGLEFPLGQQRLLTYLKSQTLEYLKPRNMCMYVPDCAYHFKVLACNY